MKKQAVLYIGICCMLAASFLTGCGPSLQERRDDIEKSMKFWVGKSETQLVAKWGPPSDVYDLNDGSKEITYRYIHRYSSWYWYPGSYRSERGFTVDSIGTIVAYRWDGF